MNYILIGSDSFNTSGQIIHAFDICQARIKNKIWPLYESTSYSKSIKKNDNFLVYVAGKYKHKHNFIMKFNCLEIKNQNFKKIDQEILNLTNPLPFKEIIFDQAISTKFVYIKDFLDELDFTKNRKSNKWGSIMMGGVKKINDDDYKFLSLKL